MIKVLPYHFVLLLILNIICFSISAQKLDSIEFKNRFDQATLLLRTEKFADALPALNELHSLVPENNNINYLLGVCYVITKTHIDTAIKLLEISSKYNTNNYIPSFDKETHSPIYSLYYLGVAYCSVNKCIEAEVAFKQFSEIVNDGTNEFVIDAVNRLNDCKSSTDFTKKLTTRKVIYTTQDPIYAVQIGAFKQRLANTNFPNLKNVKSFMDKDGMIRYVVGGVQIRATAEALRKAIFDAGYKDAFIVDINSKAKFQDEVVNAFSFIPSKIEIKKWAKIEYMVQIGAYKTQEKINEDLAEKFIQIEGINLREDGWMTLLTVGNFNNYEDAMKFKTILINQGIKDAFIIVYKNGQKISTKEAESYISKDF